MQFATAGMSMRLESPIGLPMSSVSSGASSVVCCSISSAQRSMTFLRPAGARRDQRPSSKAARAAFTARSTSSLSPAATWVSTLPSIGETQSKVLPEARSEEHTSELQSLMRISYAVFCLKKKKNKKTRNIYALNYNKNRKFVYEYINMPLCEITIH